MAPHIQSFANPTGGSSCVPTSVFGLSTYSCEPLYTEHVYAQDIKRHPKQSGRCSIHIMHGTGEHLAHRGVNLPARKRKAELAVEQFCRLQASLEWRDHNAMKVQVRKLLRHKLHLVITFKISERGSHNA